MEKENSLDIKNLISAMLLVAGCCIGGGMLGTPIGSGITGFVPSITMMIICWFFMTVSALLLVEVSLWMEEGAHVISMTSKFLGPIGKSIAWILFLYISYASQVAYAAGGGYQIASFINSFTGAELSRDCGAIILTVLFTTVIVFGSKIVGRVNSVFFTGLIFAYFALVTLGTGQIETSLLFYENWSLSWIAIPMLLTSFSFQTMVPSLTPILKRQTKALKLTIIGGTGIALLVYIIWQALVLGIVPAEGANSLSEARITAIPATQLLRPFVQNSFFVYFAEFFGFFAIITSFLAMGLGLYDFLSDGLKIKEKGYGNLVLWLLMTIPTIIFATQFERVFMIALETSGGYGDTILNGIIPILMVWIGRYHWKNKDSFRVPGGKPLLILAFIFFLSALVIQMIVQFGYQDTINDEYEVHQIHNIEDVTKED